MWACNPKDVKKRIKKQNEKESHIKRKIFTNRKELKWFAQRSKSNKVEIKSSKEQYKTMIKLCKQRLDIIVLTFTNEFRLKNASNGKQKREGFP